MVEDQVARPRGLVAEIQCADQRLQLSGSQYRGHVHPGEYADHGHVRQITQVARQQRGDFTAPSSNVSN